MLTGILILSATAPLLTRISKVGLDTNVKIKLQIEFESHHFKWVSLRESVLFNQPGGNTATAIQIANNSKEESTQNKAFKSIFGN